MVYLFDIPAFFILLRETLEVTIILAVLLGFIDKLVPDDMTLRKRLKKQIWIGTAAGLTISLIIGAIFITIFYTVARNLWEDSEAAWEGTFSLIASVIITIMSLSMVRISTWKAKWEGKLQDATELYLQKHKKGNRWALIILPFTVVLRESLESIVFIGGIGFEESASSLPIPIITGILAGFIIGWIIYAGSHKVSLHIFFITTTVFLLFIAAGLFSTAIHEFEETTEKEGEEEIVLWNATCCDPEKSYFWDIMKAIFGWRSKATLGPTVGYFVYWVVVICIAAFLIAFNRKKDNNTMKEKVDVEEIITENKA